MIQLLFTRLVQRWQIICLNTLVFWLVAASLIVMTPQSYRAKTIIVPAETTGVAVSHILSTPPFFGQTFFDTKPSGNFAVYLGALRTREIAQAVRRNTQLAHVLGAEATESWLGRLYQALGLKIALPDDDEILNWLEKNTFTIQLPNSILWQIEVRHVDPEIALSILKTMHETAEARVRDEIVSMISRRLSWLIDRAATEADAIIRTSLYDLIAQANRHSAILASDTAVAARLVSLPAVEQRPTVPNRIFLLSFSLVGALITSVLMWSAIILFQKNVGHRALATSM